MFKFLVIRGNSIPWKSPTLQIRYTKTLLEIMLTENCPQWIYKSTHICIVTTVYMRFYFNIICSMKINFTFDWYSNRFRTTESWVLLLWPLEVHWYKKSPNWICFRTWIRDWRRFVTQRLVLFSLRAYTSSSLCGIRKSWSALYWLCYLIAKYHNDKYNLFGFK